MFLFTNAPVGTRDTGQAASPAAGRTVTGSASGPVIDAIRDGAESSGVGFDYLLATARRESALDPSAKAATSSATGLYQFIEQTWLGTMKNAGAKLGLSSYSDAITARPDGTYAVSDPATKQAILDLRRDPRVSAAMAGALTQRNREALGQALGREPTSGDLYVAHVLGAKGAAGLISTAQASPARAAALDLPEAAASNRALFYDKSGRARSASELYAHLAAATSGAVPAAQASSLPEMTTAYASLEGGIRSLFQTDKRQGAVSESVAKLWQGRSAHAGPAASGPSYFPRSDQSESPDTSPAAPAEKSAAPVEDAIVVPLPPRRPAAIGVTASASATAASFAAPRANPLFDLSAYRLRSGS